MPAAAAALRGAGATMTERDAMKPAEALRAAFVAAVSIAWLRTRPAVVAPIASARTPEQLAELLPLASMRLTDAEVRKLNDASA